MAEPNSSKVHLAFKDDHHGTLHHSIAHSSGLSERKHLYCSSSIVLSFALGALLSSLLFLELFGHEMMLENASGATTTQQGKETRTELVLNHTHTAARPAIDATPTATPTPTLCEYLLSEDSLPDENISERVPTSVQAVLKSHCEIHPWLPLEELLPNMTFFERIFNTVNNYRRAYNATIDLVAGRGTTGTTTTVLRWMGDAFRFGFVHWTLARCPPFFRNQSDPVGGCIRARLGGKANDARHEARGNLMDYGVDNATLRENEYGFILNALARDLDKALSCGNCGNMVLSDSPWVNIFAELYLALGPTTKVVLLRRDAHSWASQRRRRHTSALVCLDGTVLDPFSFTQCAARNAPAGRVKRIDYEHLMKSYQKYNQYVHSIVPENYLLDINLFTNSILEAENTTDIWSMANKELIRTFLDQKEDVG